MTRLRLLVVLAAPALLPACAYYNGMYNAVHLARRAEKAEREGRTLEAEGLWGQVQVKAETVLARHPRSKWADDARFLQGKALERTGNCTAAVGPLETVSLHSADSAMADEAALLLGACRDRLGDARGAGFAVERLIHSPDPARRSEAAWRAGAAYRQSGRAAEALALLETSTHPRARGERAATLAALRRFDEAEALADSLQQEHDSTAPWGDLLAGLAEHDEARTATRLDTLLAELRPDPDSAAAWLAADAGRWFARGEPARGMARLDEAFQAAPTRPVGAGALLELLHRKLTLATDPAVLDTVTQRLTLIEPSAGTAAGQARLLGQQVARARLRLDSLDLAAPAGDLRAFLAAEELRDTLQAPGLAVRTWRQLVEARPASPYVPKALLAIAALDTAARDSLLGVLGDRYAASPYVLAAAGQDPEGFRALEDSLARFARSYRVIVRPPRPPARGRAAPTPSAAPVQ
ncbi:MAG TPA: hypothetical protein VFS07_06245 [Gemmatimonadales bacterium]|nr:hypothetical protein [Gemmatimonadales bacterium]